MPRERDDRRRDRDDRDDRRRDRDDRERRDPPQEIVLHRISISNLPSDTTWQVCALRSCLGGVPA